MSLKNYPAGFRGERNEERMRGRVIRVASRVVTLSVSLAVLTASTDTGHQSGSALPPPLDKYVTDVVKLTAEERTTLAAGGPVSKLLDVDPNKEIAVFGAIWIDAPMHSYAVALNDIETFERGGGFRKTKRLSAPPTLEDFADLDLPADDIKDLRTCKPGECSVKLGDEALQRFRTGVNWNSPTAHQTVDAVMRELALRYVTGYLEGGNERLAVYRDKERPTFVAHELRDMIDRMPELTAYLPQMRQYLLEFPEATLPDSTAFLYWQKTVFGLKPTIRISHVVIREQPTATTVASKMLYATHYFWTGLELRVLLPDAARGRGFWFTTLSRSRSDGLSGFSGSIVRRRAGREAKDGAVAALTATKAKLEAPPAR